MVLLKILLISGMVLAAAAVIVAEIAGRNFNNAFKQKVSKLFGSQSKNAQKVITEDDIKHLPEPVQRYLRYTGIIGRQRVAFVRLKQSGAMRPKPDGKWFPSSLVSDNVKWEAIDAKSARSTLTDRGITVSAVFCFDKEGKITNFIAERGRSIDGGKLVRTKWSTPISGYRTYGNGLRLPSKGEAVWHLDTGKYSYIKLEITDVEYDNPSLY